MRRSVIIYILVLSSLIIPGTTLAQDEFSPEALEIANALNCPVCQGQSARDSNSELARQMRMVIQERLDAGQSRQEILDYFVDAYGESVLREPPKSGFALTLWWTPVVALVLGVVLLGTFIRQRGNRNMAASGRQGSMPSDQSSEQERDIARYEEMIRRDLGKPGGSVR